MQLAAGNLRDSALHVGDKIPNVTIGHIIRSKATDISIADLKGKIIIIDFWATWCAACIPFLPKLQALQERFKDDVVVLAVTSQPKEQILKFVQNSPTLKNLQIPFVTDDVLLKKLFPYNAIPHEIIIDKYGVISAITGPENINDNTIHELLQGKKLRIAEKVDFTDYAHFSFMSEYVNPYVLSNFFVTRFIPGMKSSMSTDTTVECTNESLLNIMLAYSSRIYGKQQEKPVPPQNINRVVADPSINMEKLCFQKGSLELWEQNNTYCMQLRVPDSLVNKRFEIFRDEVERLFGIKCHVEQKITKCLVISCKDKNRTIPKGTYTILDRNDRLWTGKNVPISTIVNNLNNLSPYPVINETGFKSMTRVDIIFRPDFKDLKTLQKDFQKCGLDIDIQDRDIPIYVISSRK